MQIQTALGTVSVSPRQRREGITHLVHDGKVAWANVPCSDEMREFALDVTVQPNDPQEGDSPAMIFVVYNLQAAAETKTGNLPLRVPVKWENGTPKTRQRGRDNMDVIIVMPNGEFVSVECGLITRNRLFFMTLQQNYEGHVTRTRGNVWKVVPTDPIYAFPGADVQAALWGSRADAFMEKAVAHKTSERLSRVRDDVAEYNPPTLPEPPIGYQVGIVDYFDMISGVGQVSGADGGKRFVHFRAIENGGAVPTLTPMTIVQFKDQNPKPGDDRRPITTVRPYMQGVALANAIPAGEPDFIYGS